MKTALITGYSGLIGRQLLSLLLEDDRYGQVIAVGRRNLDIKHPKLSQQIIDFTDIHLNNTHIDDVFCCLGTTMKKAGSQEKFRLVDFQYPVSIASYGLKIGAKRMLLVSSLGANEKSMVFYSKVKGEVEKAISRLGYSRVDIFRPSLLLGPRDDARLAEDLGKGLMKVFGFLFVGPLKDYKAIAGSKVASAMLYFAKDEGSGIYIHSSGELQKY